MGQHDEARPLLTGHAPPTAHQRAYAGGRRLTGTGTLPEARSAAAAAGGFVWVALQEPSAADMAEVTRAFGLPVLAVEDAVHAHQRPKLEVYDGVLFMVLKPVAYVDPVEVVQVTEVAVFLGDDFVVTVRHGECAALRQVRLELDAVSQATDRAAEAGGPAPADPVAGSGPAGVLYRVADLVVDAYEAAIGPINEDVDEIEGQVFGPGDDDHAERIYKLKQEVAEFRRAVLPLARPLERLATTGIPHVPATAAPYFRDVHDHLLRAADAVEGIDRQLSDVLQANTARVTTGQSRVALRQNEDMRKISSWAAIALVPTAVAGVYGMNFEHMPELGWTFGYPAVLALIAGACLTLHRLFRRNGWL